MADFVTWLAKLFGHIDTQGIEALLFQAIQVAVLSLGAAFVNFLLQRAISKHLDLGLSTDARNVFTYRRLARLAVLIPTILISLHVLGINMMPIFATGSVFALALGFGMKNVAENFISGVILRFEKTTRPGSILELNGTVMSVKSVGLRSTKSDAFNGREILIPNSDLLRSQIGAFTLSDNHCRIQSDLCVSSEFDPKRVQDLLHTAISQQNWMAEGHSSAVVLTGFEDDLVCYRVFAWLDDPAKLRDGLSMLNRTIWQALADNDIPLGVQRIKLEQET